MSETVAALTTPKQFRVSRGHIFSCDTSLEWFERKYRSELVAGGALLILAGRKMIDPAKYDAVIIEVGQRAAGKVAA